MSVYRPKLQLSSLHQQPLCLCIILWMETRSIRWVTLLLFIIIYVNRTKGTQRMMQKSTEKEKKNTLTYELSVKHTVVGAKAPLDARH